jgi:uncharacterized protein
MASWNDKPIPEVVELTRPFWEGARNGKLMMQKCARCGTVNFLPKPWCVDCGARDMPWVEIRPEGTIYSYTVSYTVMMNFQGWGKDLPLVEAIIDLDDGGRLYAQVTTDEPEKVRIGDRVTAYFEPINEEIGIPKFHIAGAAR